MATILRFTSRRTRWGGWGLLPHRTFQLAIFRQNHLIVWQTFCCCCFLDACYVYYTNVILYGWYYVFIGTFFGTQKKQLGAQVPPPPPYWVQVFQVWHARKNIRAKDLSHPPPPPPPPPPTSPIKVGPVRLWRTWRFILDASAWLEQH